MSTAGPGRKLLGCIVVSFGLLCVLQAALNICLRLALYSTPGTDASCKNLTEERDTFGTEASCKNLTEEKDELKRELDNFASQLNSVMEERDELERRLNVYSLYLDQEWVYFDGSFYFSSSIKRNWQNSRNDCLQRGADLIIINSREEQEFIRRFKGIMWIGLTDRQTEGRWKWVDGTLLTTRFWRSGEPNNYKNTNEDCIERNSNDGLNSWNDVPCGNQNLWICEKKISL